MVGKLYKHEFKAWLRIMSIIYGITLAVAAMLRIAQIFESDTVYYNTIFASGVFMYIVALLVAFASPVVFGVVRFYRNLFTGEGYLTFTLPATPANHLAVKVTTAVVFSILSVLVCVGSVMIVTAGDVFTELCKAADYLIRLIPADISAHLAGYCVELVFLLLVVFFVEHLLMDTCVCIGQLFRKNRVLAAVGVYFGIYVITQVISTVFGIGMVVLEEAGVLETLYAWIEENTYTAVHIALCGTTVLYAVLALVYYLICHWVVRKKLNLE
jgi:hypothetical protein